MGKFNLGGVACQELIVKITGGQCLEGADGQQNAGLKNEAYELIDIDWGKTVPNFLCMQTEVDCWALWSTNSGA